MVSFQEGSTEEEGEKEVEKEGEEKEEMKEGEVRWEGGRERMDGRVVGREEDEGGRWGGERKEKGFIKRNCTHCCAICSISVQEEGGRKEEER